MAADEKNEDEQAFEDIEALAPKSESEDVEKALEQVSRGANVQGEDLTRSNVHTGTYQNGEAVPDDSVGGDAPRVVAAQAGAAEGPATQDAVAPDAAPGGAGGATAPSEDDAPAGANADGDASVRPTSAAGRAPDNEPSGSAPEPVTLRTRATPADDESGAAPAPGTAAPTRGEDAPPSGAAGGDRPQDDPGPSFVAPQQDAADTPPEEGAASSDETPAEQGTPTPVPAADADPQGGGNTDGTAPASEDPGPVDVTGRDDGAEPAPTAPASGADAGAATNDADGDAGRSGATGGAPGRPTAAPADPAAEDAATDDPNPAGIGAGPPTDTNDAEAPSAPPPTGSEDAAPETTPPVAETGDDAAPDNGDDPASEGAQSGAGAAGEGPPDATAPPETGEGGPGVGPATPPPSPPPGENGRDPDSETRTPVDAPDDGPAATGDGPGAADPNAPPPTGDAAGEPDPTGDDTGPLPEPGPEPDTGAGEVPPPPVDPNTQPTGLTLTPERAEFPIETPAAGDPVTLDVTLAGEAFRGDPGYRIIVDGKTVARGKVDWARDTREEGLYDLKDGREEVEWRDISVDLVMPTGGFETVEIKFSNDAYKKGVGDRNLLIDKISMNGAVIEAEADSVDYRGGKFDDGVTSERMPWRGSLEFDVANIFEGATAKGPESAHVIEGVEGAVIGQLDFDDPDQGDTHSFEVSDDRFEVVDKVLRLKPGESLSFEDGEVVEVDVTVTDAGGLSQTATFPISVLDVNEAPEGVTLDTSYVVTGKEGVEVGTLNVIDQDAGDSHVIEVSDDRFEVVDGALRLKPGVALDREEAAKVDVEITATDASGLSVTETLSVNVAPSLDMKVGSGFHAKYFDMDERLARISDVDWEAAPSFAEVTDKIDYDNGRESFWEGGDTDTFAAEITGTIEVTEAGAFDFFLSADDGAHLFINGEPVIDNDGLHSYRERSGEIELEPGLHHIEVRYFENMGRAGLRLEWDGPGTGGRSLVEPAAGEGIPAIAGLATPLDLVFPDGAPAEGVGVILDGLPEGTRIEAGDMMAVIDETGTLDITAWDLSMLTVQPPPDVTGPLDAGIVLEYGGGPDMGGVAERLPLGIEVSEALVTPPSAEMVGGFTASYFDVDERLRSTDDIDWNDTPTHSEVIEEIDYENSRESFWEGGSRDTFGVKIEGEIAVEEGGVYTFHAGADDGVVVFVNGEPVVDNDGLHGFRTRSGEIELAPGTYDIEVRYFENYGHAGLRLEWEGPDTDGRELLPARPAFETEPNGTFDVGLNLARGDGDEHIEIAGLPVGTIINSGDKAMIVEEDPIDVTDWDLTSIQISPPPDFEGLIEGSVVVTDIAFNGAEVSGATPFLFTVGDPEATPEGRPLEMELPPGAQGGGAADWTQGDDASDGGMDDDVMKEPVEDTGGNDGGGVSLDIYEKPDV